ncbi:hypothetical protein N7535_008446 [Penicillium sp. DV-2018c]|nr:hypothetical protein N7535_008446 [Penicillium sp. DV-2018c]
MDVPHCPVQDTRGTRDYDTQGSLTYEDQFLAAGEDFIIKFCDERRFLSLGDGRRPKTIFHLRKLVIKLDLIIDIAEKMAVHEPDCSTIRLKPTGHFQGEFRRLVIDYLMSPIIQAITTLKAAEESDEPLETVDFHVANDLFQINEFNPLLTWGAIAG